jgi:hypothetical protein
MSFGAFLSCTEGPNICDCSILSSIQILIFHICGSDICYLQIDKHIVIKCFCGSS